MPKFKSSRPLIEEIVGKYPLSTPSRKRYYYEPVYPYVKGVYGPPRDIYGYHPSQLAAMFNVRMQMEAEKGADALLSEAVKKQLAKRSLVPSRLQKDMKAELSGSYGDIDIDENPYDSNLQDFYNYRAGRMNELRESYPGLMASNSFLIDTDRLPNYRAAEIYGMHPELFSFESLMGDRLYMDGYKKTPIIKGKDNKINEELVKLWNGYVDAPPPTPPTPPRNNFEFPYQGVLGAMLGGAGTYIGEERDRIARRRMEEGID